MKFNFKKVSSVIASVAMIGSTLGIAAAASYPIPFVSGGVSDVAIVIGSGAQPSDILAATDLGSKLGAAQTTGAATATTTTAANLDCSGENSKCVLLAKRSDALNLNDVISTVFGSTVSDDDLPDLLASGSYTNDENTPYDYEQKLTLGAALQVNHFAHNDYKSKEPSVGINMSSSQHVLTYTLDFNEEPLSEVVSGDLVDIETTTLPLLGKNYFVLNFDNSTLDLTLLDSAEDGFVAEGETVTVMGKEVSIVHIDSSEVKLDIDGESTSSLVESGTYKLSDGTYVGIKDILHNSKTGTTSSVEFSIGTGKLELKGTLANIKLNDDSINEIQSVITRGTSSGGKTAINKIELNWTTDDRTFLAPDSELLMPGFEALKFTMPGFITPQEEILTVKDAGSDSVAIKLTIEDGEINLPILYKNDTMFLGSGDSDDERLVTSKDITGILYNDSLGDRYMALTWNDSRDAESYIIKFTSFSRTNGINYTTVQKLTDGNVWKTICADKSDSGGSTSDCTSGLGSATLSINSISGQTDKTVNVTGGSGTTFHMLYTKGGLGVYLPTNGTGGFISGSGSYGR